MAEQPPAGGLWHAAAAFEKAVGLSGTPHERWALLQLHLDGKGLPIPNAFNARQIIARDQQWRGRFWFDEFHQRIRTDIGGSGPRDLKDADEYGVAMQIQGELQIGRMTIEAVRMAIATVADQDRRSEPREWIRSLHWDGGTRLGLLMSRGFGADDNDYTMRVGENLIKSCVMRIEHPGCKVDAMPVLEGPQGIGKTRAIEILAAPWYGSLHSSFGTKDALLEMQRKLILEVAELEAMPKREFETVKAFLSRRIDTFRPPYGRHPVDVPRRCVFLGSTNETCYLRDATGGRRFLPIRCGQIDLKWIEAERDQLFAEAAHRLKQDESWWEVPIDEAQREQDARFAGDPWIDPLDRYLTLRESTTMAGVLTEALKIEVGRQSKRDQMRAAAIMERLGWSRVQSGQRRTRIWIPPDVEGGSGGSKVVRIKAHQIQSYEPHEPPEHSVHIKP